MLLILHILFVFFFFFCRSFHARTYATHLHTYATHAYGKYLCISICTNVCKLENLIDNCDAFFCAQWERVWWAWSSKQSSCVLRITQNLITRTASCWSLLTVTLFLCTHVCVCVFKCIHICVLHFETMNVHFVIRKAAQNISPPFRS